MWTVWPVFSPHSQGAGASGNPALTYRFLELGWGIGGSDNTWGVKRGWGWNKSTNVGSSDKLIVVPPASANKWERAINSNSPSVEKKVVMGIVDKGSTSQNKNLLQSLSISINNEGGEKEFWGGDGTFNVANAGYKNVEYNYVRNHGWKKGDSSTSKDISEELKK